MQLVSASGHHVIEADRIAAGLYQGSKPLPGRSVAHLGFDVLVLCAYEYQPDAEQFPGVKVVRALLDDSGVPMTQAEWNEAAAAANVVSQELTLGRRVLVTCQQGINRSGLVTALALWQLSGKSGADVVSHVQRRRPGALRNRWFQQALLALPARSHAPKKRRARK